MAFAIESVGEISFTGSTGPDKWTVGGRKSFYTYDEAVVWASQERVRAVYRAMRPAFTAAFMEGWGYSSDCFTEQAAKELADIYALRIISELTKDQPNGT